MTDIVANDIIERSYWPRGTVKNIVTALTGMIAVFVAYQAAIYEPQTGVEGTYQNHIGRALTFAALTIWLTLTLGVRKRGLAAVAALVIASLLDIFIMSYRGEQMGTIVASNMGIALAYCGMQLYWFELQKARRRAIEARKAAA